VEAADRPVKTYSGGMRRRLDLAGALVAEPPVLFLDEPTTGLDPRSRTELWREIRELVDRGTTVMLTTQYLEEADRLADEIMVIHHGKAIAQGSSNALKLMVGGDRIEVVVDSVEAVGRARVVLGRFSEGDMQVDERTRTIVAPISGGAAVFTQALRALDEEGLDLHDVSLRRPTLDDVFLTLTGHGAEVADDAEVNS
jgi:ABC-2 type transport system ATP-binding protein